MSTESASKSPRRLLDVSRDDGMNLKRKGRLEKNRQEVSFVWCPEDRLCDVEALTKKEKRASKKAFVALVMLLTALTIVSVCLSVYASRSQRRIANYERILAEGGQMGDAGRFEAPVPDEVPKIEMRKVGDARVSPLHYGDDAAEGV